MKLGFLKPFLLILLVLMIGCVRYSANFASDGLRSKPVPEKYQHSFSMHTMGPGNTENFIIYLITSILQFNGLKVFEIQDTVNNYFNVDSIWIINPDCSYKTILKPYDTSYNQRQEYRLLSLRPVDNNISKLNYSWVYIHDSISVLHVYIPYYADIEGIRIYDTLFSEMHRVVEKNRFVVP